MSKIQSYSLTIIICALVFTAMALFALLQAQEQASNIECDCDPKFYDYVIVLKKDDIHVYKEKRTRICCSL